MKFLPLTLAALTSAAALSTKSELQRTLASRMKNGELNKRTLMRGAKPYGESTKRKLEEAQGDQFEIDSNYSIEFDRCFSLTVQDEDLFGDNVIEYAKEGQVVAQKSLVLFKVCESNNCNNTNDDEAMTFVTDIATFFRAFMDFLPNKVERYCEGCRENEGYCTGEAEAEYYEWLENQAEEEEEAAQDDAVQQEDEDQEQDADQDDGEQEDNQDQEDAQEDAQDDGQEDAQDDGQEDAQDDGQDDGQDDAQDEGNEDGNADEGGERARKLALKRRVEAADESSEYIDCNMCNEYACFDEEGENNNNNNNNAVYDRESALQWIEEIAQCQQIEQDADDYQNAEDDGENNLFAGLMCNEQGTGVEIAVFSDEECTLYNKMTSYQSIMSYSDQQYYALSLDVVEYMFVNTISCYDQEIEYTNPYAEMQKEAKEENDDYNAAEEEEDYEAAEWCRDLFDGEMEALDLSTCGGAVDQNDDYNNAEEEVYDEMLDYYDWYSYELTEEAVNDAAEVCLAVQGLEGEYSTIYEYDSSGSLYSYKRESVGGSIWNEEGRLAFNVGQFMLILILSAAAFLWVWCCCCPNSGKSRRVGTKNEPLL